MLQSSADCLQEKATSVGVDARLQGTYEQPSTGTAIRWHTNRVIPIAKGAKTCTNTSIRFAMPYTAKHMIWSKPGASYSLSGSDKYIPADTDT